MEVTRVLRELANDPATDTIQRNPHWRESMCKRGITLADIPSTLARGAVTEDQGIGKFGERCRVQVRDDEGKSINIIIEINEEVGRIWLITTF